MKEINMTTGSATKKILLYTLPILMGNVFQQIYSLSDTLVVGRFLGSEALAAVGASSALMVFITSIIIGLTLGSSVLFANLYAEKNDYKLSRAMSTSIIFIIAIALFMSIVLIVFLNPLLRLFQVPSESFLYAKQYLYIVLSGLVFLTLFNIGSSMLRAIGNSKTPLIFLIISSSVNVLFDFVFVLWIPLGVKGPALSTLLAQIASGIPIFIIALKRFKYLNIRLIFDIKLFREVGSYAVLTSLQQSIMNFGILLIQGLVNTFSVAVVAAFAIGVRIDAFAYMPAQDFGNAFSIYTSQNKGAKLPGRIRKGFKSAIVMSSIFCGVISILIFMFAPNLIMLFSPENTEVIVEGAKYLRIEGAFYIFIGYLFIHYGFNRGLGNFKYSIVLTIISLGTRVFLSYLFVGIGYGIQSIWFSIVIGWIIADITGFYMYHKQKKNDFLNTKALQD